MAITSVTSKGQVTIPKEIRQRLGIRQGSRIEFAMVGEVVQMRVHGESHAAADSGYGMLKSGRKSVPVDFDPASLLMK